MHSLRVIAGDESKIFVIEEQTAGLASYDDSEVVMHIIRLLNDFDG